MAGSALGRAADVLLLLPDAPEAAEGVDAPTTSTTLQIAIGDLHGLVVMEHQPVKLAAIEGNWDRRANMPLRLFAIPDEAAETNHYEIAIPKLGWSTYASPG